MSYETHDDLSLDLWLIRLGDEYKRAGNRERADELYSRGVEASALVRAVQRINGMRIEKCRTV